MATSACDGRPWGFRAVAVASADFQPAQFGDGPMTSEISPIRMHALITYLDAIIEVWLVTRLKPTSQVELLE